MSANWKRPEVQATAARRRAAAERSETAQRPPIRAERKGGHCRASGAGRLHPHCTQPRKGGCDEGLLEMKRRPSFLPTNAFVLACERLRFDVSSAVRTRRDGWGTHARRLERAPVVAGQAIREGRPSKLQRQAQQTAVAGQADCSGGPSNRRRQGGMGVAGRWAAETGLWRWRRRLRRGGRCGTEKVAAGHGGRTGETKHPHARSKERHGDESKGKCARCWQSLGDVRTWCAGISG